MEKFILEHLQCAICNQYFSNMMQCYNGHAHCYDCIRKYEINMRKKDVHCTICRSKKGWCTNRQIFQVALQSGICIECGIEDCKELISIELLSDHRRKCPCTRFRCPFLSCSASLLSHDLVEHVQSHNKITNLSGQSHYMVAFSEMTQFDPKICIYNDNVIQLHYQTFYDRKMETRVIMKAYILGHKDQTNINLIVYQWNMLNDNYSKYVVRINSEPESDLTELPDTVVMTGMRNYIHEPPDCCYCLEQKIDGHPSMKPKIPIKMYDTNSNETNEDSQEVHVFTFSFQTCKES